MSCRPLPGCAGKRLAPSGRRTAPAAAVLLLAGLGLMATPATAQPPDDPPPPQPPHLVFSEEVAVEWVTVPVSVVKTAGGSAVLTAGGGLPGLALDDFELRVDGRNVEVESFEHGDAPFGLLFAQDLSGSMAHGDKLRLSRNALALLLARAGELDEVAILTFAGPSVDVQVPFTSEIQDLDQASARWRPYGTTALYDALARVAEIAKDSHRSRRAVVLLSDGIDNASTIPAEQARSLLQGAGMPVFVLDVAARFERAGGTLSAPVVLDEATRAADPVAFTLAELAHATGGLYLDVADHAAMQSAANQVLIELRQQYLLGFTTDSASPAAWHRIEVAVRTENTEKSEKGGPARLLRFRTRYFGSQPAGWSAGAVSAVSSIAVTGERRARRADRPRIQRQLPRFE